MMKLMSILGRRPDEEDDRKEERDSRQELIKHHLQDMKEALSKAHGCLEMGDMEELQDQMAILVSSAADVEEVLEQKDKVPENDPLDLGI